MGEAKYSKGAIIMKNMLKITLVGIMLALTLIGSNKLQASDGPVLTLSSIACLGDGSNRVEIVFTLTGLMENSNRFTLLFYTANGVQDDATLSGQSQRMATFTDYRPGNVTYNVTEAHTVVNDQYVSLSNPGAFSDVSCGVISTNTPTQTPTNTQTATVTPTFTSSPTATPTITPNGSDIISPTVSIIFPTNGAIVPKQSVVTIQASASDNVGVTKVEFYVEGNKKCTDTVAPYSCDWTVPNQISNYRLMVKAFDAANNSATYTITVKSN